MFYTTESKKSGEITFAFQILFYVLHISASSRHYKTLMFASALNTSHLILCIRFLQAEPPPEITWLKDDEPISPWIQVINTEGMSQLCIPSSKRSDSAIYTIKAKNSVGQAVFDIEVRVTGKAKKKVLTVLGWLDYTDWRYGCVGCELLACLANKVKRQLFVLDTVEKTSNFYYKK